MNCPYCSTSIKQAYKGPCPKCPPGAFQRRHRRESKINCISESLLSLLAAAKSQIKDGPPASGDVKKELCPWGCIFDGQLLVGDCRMPETKECKANWIKKMRKDVREQNNKYSTGKSGSI